MKSLHTQREHVFLRRLENETLKFSTLPNIFCAQGDGRWWHDHRTPGDIMITSNWDGRIPTMVLEITSFKAFSSTSNTTIAK